MSVGSTPPLGIVCGVVVVGEVLILRGLPGCGKTYFARQARAGRSVLVVSADDFFVHGSEYRFNPGLLGDAHADCFRRFVETALATEYAADVLIVDNTNVRLWEISPYVAVANAFEIPYQIIHIRCSVEVAAARNVHSVPASHLKRMVARFERPLPHWNVVEIDAEV